MVNLHLPFREVMIEVIALMVFLLLCGGFDCLVIALSLLCSSATVHPVSSSTCLVSV